MSNDLMSPQDFQARMTERLREDVGKLIPDEKLSELVEQAIQSMFFKREQKTVGGGYHARTEAIPSWWEKEVNDTLKDMMRAHISGWITANAGRLERVLEESLREQGPKFVAAVFMQMIQSRVSQETFNVQQLIENGLRNGVYG